MSWVAFLAQAGSLTKEAISTNFWGLGCPHYCGSNSFTGLATSFLLGFLCGLLTLILFWIWISLALSGSPATLPPVPAPVLTIADRARRRLQGYRTVVDE